MIQEITNETEIKNFLKKQFKTYKYQKDPYEKHLAYIDKEIISLISYSIIYERAEINFIATSKEHQKQGHATTLLKAAIKDIKKHKCQNITLEVKETNQKAINLYKTQNFKKIAIRKNYYGNENAYLMEKKLEGEKMNTYILAIESSCDETSASIIKNGNEEISTVVLSQMDTHANFGGVVPEIASRMHIENITIVLEETLKKSNLTMDDITAIAVTYAPGLIGSLLVGLMAAKTLAYIYNKPLVPVHHHAGHIYANNLVKPLEFPLIALVVSGGHTDLFYMPKNYEFKHLGGTLDDAVGEAYDKVARVLNLPYPGGPLVDKLAQKGNDTYNLPLPLDDDTYNFSFSGIKSAVINIAHNEKQKGNEINKENMAASFQNRATKILTKKTMHALKEYNVKNLILAGGVAANSGLRQSITKACEENKINLTIPEIKYCTDNAAMIGAAGYYAYKKGIRAGLDLNAKANEELK